MSATWKTVSSRANNIIWINKLDTLPSQLLNKKTIISPSWEEEKFYTGLWNKVLEMGDWPKWTRSCKCLLNRLRPQTEKTTIGWESRIPIKSIHASKEIQGCRQHLRRLPQVLWQDMAITQAGFADGINLIKTDEEEKKRKRQRV